ncbi:hypothetical protein [Clostridium brassicae]|uniref:Mg2+ and Co2+ transporter CorB n=1 Tax=Clostridium brassicae TaxID=2999072 RepID=A0ABT4DFS3_9CLOT|nr:hypothetical protein [Clostridium brassicae]MCY6959971.1 hypothetical protein [Clostridium brassicae]
MEKDKDKTERKNEKTRRKKKKNSNKLWIFIIVIWTIILSGSISFFSNLAMPKVNLTLAIVILIMIILIGIIFDVIGVAVTAANERPFHAMSSKKIKEAKIAIKLIRNADKVSNFCNDVIGDVCGVVSGAIGAAILSKIPIAATNTNVKYNLFLASTIGALIAALTVGGKALGKSFAMKNSKDIIFTVSKIIYAIKKERG